MAGNGRGGIGWAILAAALAVPGFLFYNWSSRLKTDPAVAAKARSRLPEGVFQTPLPSTGRLVNPIAPSTAPAPAPIPAAAPTATPVAMAAPAPAAAAPRPIPAPALPTPASAPAAALAVSSAPTVVLPRDPMLSPLDLVHLREAEIEAERARREIEDAARRRAHPERRVRREPPIENKVELQGIVGGSGSATLAIVNGSTYNTGEAFEVEGVSARVRIVKISATSVTFEYKKRRFTKSVNAE